MYREMGMTYWLGEAEAQMLQERLDPTDAGRQATGILASGDHR